MIVQFILANYGPFKEPVSLSFEATKDTHLEPSYIRNVPMHNGKTLRLLRLALIYGENAAGKSTILDALSALDRLVTRRNTDREDPLEVNPYAFQTSAEQVPVDMCLDFYAQEHIYRFHILATRLGILEESLSYKGNPSEKSQFKQIYTRKRTQLNDVFTITYGNDLKLNTAEKEKLSVELFDNTTMLATLNRKMVISSAPHIGIAYQWFKQQLMGEVSPSLPLHQVTKEDLIRGTIQSDDIQHYLNQAGIPVQRIDLKDRTLTIKEQELEQKIEQNLLENSPQHIHSALLSALQNKRKEIVMHYEVEGCKYALNFKQESLGTQRFFGLAGLMNRLLPNNTAQFARVLPIDEIEHSLHPALIEFLLSTFLNHDSNSQLIATTHYRELLDNRLLFRDDAIWFVNKDHSTMTSKLYSLADIDGVRKTSSVLNFYKQGRLGAVPKLDV